MESQDAKIEPKDNIGEKELDNLARVAKDYCVRGEEGQRDANPSMIRVFLFGVGEKGADSLMAE